MNTVSTPWSICQFNDDGKVLSDSNFANARFWEDDGSGRCLAFKKQNAVHKFATRFLPYFGFSKYRLSNSNTFLIVQKKKQRVRIIGNAGDRQVGIDIFEWFQDQVEYLKEILGTKGSGIPDGFDEQVFANADLFASWTMRHLPKLKSDVSMRPLTDTAFEANLAFENGIVRISKNQAELIPWHQIPEDLFVWDNQVINQEITLADQPQGVFWKFLQHLGLEEVNGSWLPNPLQQECLQTTLGYLSHNYKQPDNAPCAIFYDRTAMSLSGGNGKSRLLQSLSFIRPVFELSGKHLKKGDNQFAWSGYTPDKRVVVIQDIIQDFQFHNLYNQIEDAFTVEEKGKNKVVYSRDESPKIAITTNFALQNQGWSDERRQHLVPVSTFFGTQEKIFGTKIRDIIGKLLYTDWSNEDWKDFYNTVIHCIRLYLSIGLVKFKDEVYHSRVLMSAVENQEDLLIVLKGFIETVVEHQDGKTSKTEILKALDHPDLEALHRNWSGNWQLRCFKRLAEGMGYQINPGRKDGRWQRTINGKVEDCFMLVPYGTQSPHTDMDSTLTERTDSVPNKSTVPVVVCG